LRTPFWKFVIQYQTWTATTAGIDQTSTSPVVSRTRTGVREPDEQQRDQRPEHHRQRDVRGGEDDRPDERVPEDRSPRTER
jgi:hypothetical protein